MTTVYVSLNVAKRWSGACQKAITDLNRLFKQHRINVTLTTAASKGPTIEVRNDVTVQGDAVHGRTSAGADSTGKLVSADVRLPTNVTINTPNGIRDAGQGILEVIVAHEYIHALGHGAHDSHLMGQTLQKQLGDTPSGDRLKAGVISMPPLALSPETIQTLKAIWT